jgi:Kef-type K+ transport system membrane component KefB
VENSTDTFVLIAGLLLLAGRGAVAQRLGMPSVLGIILGGWWRARRCWGSQGTTSSSAAWDSWA